MAGFREEQIESLAFQSGPFWPGTKHSAAMRVPVHLKGYTRVHVEVRFARGVIDHLKSSFSGLSPVCEGWRHH
jgi:hypothetical protein